MDPLTFRSELAPIAEKVAAGERLTFEDGLTLFRTRDINGLGRLADAMRTRLNGRFATFIRNRYINYSNICILSCQFCSFARKKRDPDAWQYSVEEMAGFARQAVDEGATELHIVGGLHPSLPFDYYLDMLRALKEAGPPLHLKIFTAIEIRHLADRIAKRSIPATLETLREAGLGSLTGGGAEIFNPTVRDQICRGKETAEEWLEVHRIWHQMGGRSTCTMLYGHVESLEDRVDHLLRLRALQDETRGFTAFVPLPFQPEDNALSHIPRCSGFEDLRVLAASRLLLDNVQHLTGYWIGLGVAMAQVSLSFGVDDLHGTIMDERIFHMAGASSPQQMTVPALQKLIREAGREPRERNSLFQHIHPEPEEAPACAAAALT